MHVPIDNLLELAEKLYIKNTAQIVTDIQHVEDLFFIQQNLVGRMISSVSAELRLRFIFSSQYSCVAILIKKCFPNAGILPCLHCARHL